MKGLYTVSKYLGLGFQIAGVIIVPVLIGVFLDTRFETRPWGVLTGTLLGFLGLFGLIYKLAVQLSEADEKSKKRKPDA